MNEKRRVLMSHYDLDGVGSDIFMSNVYKFDKKHMCGYTKIKDKIDNGDLVGYYSVVVTDISLTSQQFKKISDEYGDKFLYIDHHKPSIKAIEGIDHNSFCIVNTSFSATALILQTFLKKLNRIPNSIKFATAIDAYDMWRVDTHYDNFRIGYDLNILFWKYGYFKFYDRFFDDMSFNYNACERRWISNHKKERDEIIINSDKTEFGNNSILVLNAPTDYVNDYTIQLPDYDFYFMLINHDDILTISIRSKRNKVYSDVGDIVRTAKENYTCIVTAGGHPNAGGIDFEKDTSIEIILDVVEFVNNKLELNNELPF